MGEHWTIHPDGSIEIRETAEPGKSFQAIVSTPEDYALAVSSLGGFDNQEIILIEETLE